MPVSPSYRAFALDQLGRVARNVTARSMFGGVGIYSGDLFFALIANDTLYLKVDETNRGDFAALGLGPFRPYGPESEGMHYYETPVDVLEEPEQLRAWAQRAIEVARRARAVKSAKPPARRSNRKRKH